MVMGGGDAEGAGTEDDPGGEGWRDDDDDDRRAQATAWLQPLPPQPVEKEVALRVSPGRGRRGVRVMRSVLREPMMVIVGVGILLFFFLFGGWGEGLLRLLLRDEDEEGVW